MLYLKGCKWLLSQKQWIRNNIFGHRWYKALAKHIKPFEMKTLKWKDVSARTNCMKHEELKCAMCFTGLRILAAQGILSIWKFNAYIVLRQVFVVENCKVSKFRGIMVKKLSRSGMKITNLQKCKENKAHKISEVLKCKENCLSAVEEVNN